jgi:hypothetical protein
MNEIFFRDRCPKDKRTHRDFLDNPSANMKVIVDRENILEKCSGGKIFHQGSYILIPEVIRNRKK